MRKTAKLLYWRTGFVNVLESLTATIDLHAIRVIASDNGAPGATPQHERANGMLD
jgi:hypothetical protein